MREAQGGGCLPITETIEIQGKVSKYSKTFPWVFCWLKIIPAFSKREFIWLPQYSCKDTLDFTAPIKGPTRPDAVTQWVKPPATPAPNWFECGILHSDLAAWCCTWESRRGWTAQVLGCLPPVADWEEAPGFGPTSSSCHSLLESETEDSSLSPSLLL